MPIRRKSPGVYIEEIPSGLRAITGVSTSIVAFVGRTEKGPEDEPVAIASFGDYQRIFGNLWNKSTLSFAVRDFFMNGGGEALVVRVSNEAERSSLAIAGEITVEASSNGEWGNELSIWVDHTTTDPQDENLFNLHVDDSAGQVEHFPNLSIQESSPNYAVKVVGQKSNLIRISSLETRPGIIDHTSKAPLIHGKDGNDISSVQVEGDENDRTGLYALEKAELFNILCIPPYVYSRYADGTTTTYDIENVTYQLALTYCEKKRAVLVMDPPDNWEDAQEATSGVSSFGYRNSHAAIYFPRLLKPNPLAASQIEEFVPCGAVAGMIAKTDARRGVWKAPAGTNATLTGISGLSVSLTHRENGKLNRLGVNCLRSFPVFGNVVWGSRTLAGADVLVSEWKYLPVRRTALYIEESLVRGLKWAVFEPNDEPLWAQIRLNITAFMHNLFRQGAFQGASPEKAYFVRCNRETTTQNDIDLGVVNILVGFAPLKPAEFVLIKLQQRAGEVDT